MIPVKVEPKGYFAETGTHKKCHFCKKYTITRHESTNAPVCNDCAKIHTEEDLPLKPPRKITLREQFELETCKPPIALYSDGVHATRISAPSLDYMNWLEDKLEKTYQQGGSILEAATEFINDPQHLLGSNDRTAIRWFVTFATERLYRDIHGTNKVNNREDSKEKTKYIYAISVTSPGSFIFRIYVAHEQAYTTKEFQAIVEQAMVETLNKMVETQYTSIWTMNKNLLLSNLESKGFTKSNIQQDYCIEPMWNKNAIKNEELQKWVPGGERMKEQRKE